MRLILKVELAQYGVLRPGLGRIPQGLRCHDTSVQPYDGRPWLGGGIAGP
jgi:hypothetical protein